MPWTSASRQSLPALEKLIREHELSSASLSARLKAGVDSKTLILPDRRRVNLWLYFDPQRDDGHILGLMYLDRNGFSFPLLAPDFPHKGRHDEEDPSIELAELIRKDNTDLFSVMGIKSHCDYMLSSLQRRPFHRVEYQVMSRDPAHFSGPMSYDPDIRIETATRGDADGLLPLQLAYEEEEVLIPGKSINASFSYQQLIQSIVEQKVLYMEYRGRIVAKAQTNAIGLGVEQIGGVYTHPDFRNRGFGTILVERLSRMILANGRLVSLFVKIDNPAAIQVYNKCGFIRGPGFSIGYF